MGNTQPDFIQLATPGVRTLQPYQPGKPLEELQREYSIQQAIKLASNENSLGPSPKAVAAMREHLAEVSRYPDGNGFALKQALAQHHDIALEQITLGNGSNDILELITRAFVTPEHEVIFSQHAFAVYPIVTQAVGAKAVVIPAVQWGHDLAAMSAAITEKTRLIFIANPNNPTGTWINKEQWAAFINTVPQHVLVLLDEAYYEYANAPDLTGTNYPNGLQWLTEHPNLIVTRTFSKIYGLAGLRVGYGVAHAQITDVLNRVRQPFNVNSLALVAAQAALDDHEHISRSVKMNTEGLQQLREAFTAMGLAFIPSVGNFICAEIGPNAMAVYEDLLREGVIVRPIASYEMPNHLRFTIGTQEENQRVIAALEKILKK